MERILPCPPERRGEIWENLRRYNDPYIPRREDLSQWVLDDDGICVAGVIAYFRADCAGVDILWVDESRRGTGLGRRLLEHVEREAAARGARRLMLDTFAFQAPGFYEKLGYRCFGRLEPCVSGYDRYYFVKELTQAE